jgi:hypothetical protein
MKTRLFAAAAAALATAGFGLAQSPSLPSIAPIPIAPLALPGVAEPTAPSSQQGEQQKTPQKPLVDPSAPMGAPAPMGTPIPMAAPEQPCPTCGNQWVDEHLGPQNSFWVRTEYSYLWFAGARVPTLALDSGTGAVLLGGANQSFTGAMAGAVQFGGWLNERHTIGIYGGGMMTDKRSAFVTVASDGAGNPGIVRPFVNALTGQNDVLIVSAPGVATGSLATNVSARLDGAQGGLVWNVFHCPNYSVNFTFGYRYFDLDEQLSIYQATQFLGANGPVYTGSHPAAGVSANGPLAGLQIDDRFRTRNQFSGVEFGIDGEWCFGPIFVGLTPKVAFGTNRQTVDVDGATTFVGQTGNTLTVPGGLFAVGGLLGHNTVSRFAVLTDITGKVGVQLTAGCRVTVGYNFLYLNTVARPGLELRETVSPRFVPASQAFGSTSGPAAPFPANDRTDYVAHGIVLGLEFRY